MRILNNAEDDMIEAEWIAVDWGTSHLRAWAMQDGAPLATGDSTKGMGRLAPDEFEPALLEVIGGWLKDGGTDVICCGMVGARQGWQEAPYSAVPTKPSELPPIFTVSQDPRISVHILPGLRQDNPADVMRGEETQIAGFIAQNPNWDGVLCLPGTHTKWAHVSAGEVVSFRTFMTGEMFALLSSQSVLRHSVTGDGWDNDAFLAAVSDAMSHPDRIAARLFSLRAEDLLHGQGAEVARATLSGLLVGAELSAARPFWLGQQVALIGSGATAPIYGAALKAQGVPTRTEDVARMTLAGLTAAYIRLKETE
ncbi:2-dehydro-3-deoxygalactonokinase [Shimia biformata]|uniref:2-dehydro-3-deoxygalactonokinase n=1 Tax=Shimia biformata TaxID=1294299 RepID=UPI001EF3CB7D|nr:2-dehydro-3-deoxygalactonokinase [Shimia biformata]